ncbi:hypothetical protein OK016_00850 [Vibrio chagasii]|nr:hypothetical protein [Vibrio chagasii]
MVDLDSSLLPYWNAVSIVPGETMLKRILSYDSFTQIFGEVLCVGGLALGNGRWHRHALRRRQAANAECLPDSTTRA